MAKSNKATVSRRVLEVLRLTLAGAEFPEIQQYASEKGWDISERQLRRYLELAYQELGETAQRDRQQLIGRHMMQRRALYARALKANDIRTALQVLRDEAALLGLYAPTKIAPTTPDGKALSFDQRQFHINAILAEKLGIVALVEKVTNDNDSRTNTQSSSGFERPGTLALESSTEVSQSVRANQDTSSTTG